jgi:lipopolysaccharide/colanic/teichoic acid biosynthesis glycosyltransferase
MPKRLFDIGVALLLLIVLSPLLLVIAILIKLDSPGPSLYTSQRVGRQGHLFRMFRFRTMTSDSADGRSAEHRLTGVGRFIRNYSLDDLPNLINVLKGEMSIVGPRPMEPERVDVKDPSWQRILTVKPGMISWAILSLARTYNASGQAVKQQLELEYVQYQSLLFDMQVLGQAVKALLASRGNVKARGRPTEEK